MEDNFVNIRNYHDYITAQLIVKALNDAGITTYPINENNAIPGAETFHIMVPEHEVENALDVIERNEDI